MLDVLRRLAVVVALAVLGALLAAGEGSAAAAAGAALGAAAAIVAVVLERALARRTREELAGGLVGTAAGLALAGLARLAAPAVFGVAGAERAALLTAVVAVALAWLGATLGARRVEARTAADLDRARPALARIGGSAKIVDTSVIIDSRIVDVVAAGFVEGPIVIPQFVLRELQQVADSSDSLKRNRGRKGLDTLRALQESPRIQVEFTAEDTTDVREVDAKLLWLAERRAAKILTNDYNLNKVAQLRGIEVLNVNDLANAMKPVVLPGEPLTLQVIKEGKERNQGVGYLDDGTMVVVENGRRLIGQKLDVTVTSVIQTNAGKMIFAQPAPDEPEPRPRVVRRMPEVPAGVAALPQVPHVGES